MSKLSYRKLHPWKYQTTIIMRVKLDFICPDVITEYISIINGVLIVYTRYCWDGPSGPTWDTPNFMRGSLFHDALYQLIKEKLLGRLFQKDADDLLKKICLEDGMGKFRAGYVHWAVRTFGKWTLNKKYYPGQRYVTIRDGKVVK